MVNLKYGFSADLKIKLKKIFRKDKHKYKIILKKMTSIADSDELTIEHYKNLCYGLKETKRVHIDKSFVLTFKYDKKKKFILFLDFDHHDNIYKK